jgi:hypothetical protein
LCRRIHKNLQIHEGHIWEKPVDLSEEHQNLLVTRESRWKAYFNQVGDLNGGVCRKESPRELTSIFNNVDISDWASVLASVSRYE